MKYPLGFVVVVEPGDLEQKVVLLAESLRRFGGRLANAPLWAVQPRNSRKKISQNTLKRFAKLDVYYVFADVNRLWGEYIFANKHYAVAFIEEFVCSSIDTLCFLDSDTLFLNTPEELILSKDQDIAVCPIHIHKGNESSWLVEEMENPLWEFLLDIAEANKSCLWPIYTRVDQRRVWAYFQGGLIAVNPEKAIFRKVIHNFERLKQDQRWRKYYQTYYITMEQVLLTATILAEVPRERILLLGPHYNYPINFHKEITESLKAEFIDKIVHIHYHDAFYNTNWMDSINIDEEIRQWFLERLPLSANFCPETALLHEMSYKELFLQIGRKSKHALFQQLGKIG